MTTANMDPCITCSPLGDEAALRPWMPEKSPVVDDELLELEPDEDPLFEVEPLFGLTPPGFDPAPETPGTVGISLVDAAPLADAVGAPASILVPEPSWDLRTVPLSVVTTVLLRPDLLL